LPFNLTQKFIPLKEKVVNVSRRSFMKYCIGSAAALGLDVYTLGSLEKALATGGGPPIIWLAASNCTGCTVSLANLVSTKRPTDVADLFINTINLAYHPNLMGAAGDLAVQTLRKAEAGTFILAVEGSIPTLYNGKTCILWSESGRDVTAMEAVMNLAPKAAKVLSIGTCSSFGGISAASPNPTQAKSVKALTGTSTINIPGCPAHPDWIVGTIAKLLAGVTPALDSYGRPKDYFASRVHDKCPRRDAPWATTFGQEGRCLHNLGCKGTNTSADCPTRQWNNKTNWCVGANALCIGCTESTFPDQFSPIYSTAGALPRGHERVSPARKTCTACHGQEMDD
jgi:hydrogenase small subunit